MPFFIFFFSTHCGGLKSGQWHSLTIDSDYEMSALIIALPKNSISKFSEEFSKYALQKDEFSKCVFLNADKFSFGLVFHIPPFGPVDLSIFKDFQIFLTSLQKTCTFCIEAFSVRLGRPTSRRVFSCVYTV